MDTEGNRGKTKKEIREDKLRDTFDELSAAFFPSKNSPDSLRDHTSAEDAFQLDRWQWEGGA